MIIRHSEEIRCKECGGELDALAHSENGESRFAFAVTHRRDGSVVKNPLYATIEAAQCRQCGRQEAVIDSLCDDGKEEAIWASLPKWHSVH
jgi:hypothetical protein